MCFGFIYLLNLLKFCIKKRKEFINKDQQNRESSGIFDVNLNALCSNLSDTKNKYLTNDIMEKSLKFSKNSQQLKELFDETKVCSRIMSKNL